MNDMTFFLLLVAVYAGLVALLWRIGKRRGK